MGDLSWGKDVEFFQNVINTRIGLLKECYESLLLDLGPVCNKFEYENYYIENPCSFGSGGGISEITGEYGSAGCFTGKSIAEKMKMCGITHSMMSGSEAQAAGLITTVSGFEHFDGPSSLPMNKFIQEDFKAICKEIMALGWYKLNISNCFRPKNSVPGKMSKHCWGVAVDINAAAKGNPWFATHITDKNASEPAEGSSPPWGFKMYSCGPYHRDRCIWHWNHPVVKIFLAHGWGWGGAYGDVMHFSVMDGH